MGLGPSLVARAQGLLIAGEGSFSDFAQIESRGPIVGIHGQLLGPHCRMLSGAAEQVGSHHLSRAPREACFQVLRYLPSSPPVLRYLPSSPPPHKTNSPDRPTFCSSSLHVPRALADLGNDSRLDSSASHSSVT